MLWNWYVDYWLVSIIYTPHTVHVHTCTIYIVPTLQWKVSLSCQYWRYCSWRREKRVFDCLSSLLRWQNSATVDSNCPTVHCLVWRWEVTCVSCERVTMVRYYSVTAVLLKNKSLSHFLHLSHLPCNVSPLVLSISQPPSQATSHMSLLSSHPMCHHNFPSPLHVYPHPY